MTSPLPTVVLRDVEPFMIAKSTRVVVRLDDLRFGLYQECKIVRKQGASVDASLHEYGGTRFRIRVDLDRRTVSLISPDYSWLPQPEDIPAAVARKIAQMLAMRRSTHTLHITRYREKFAGKHR